MIMFLRVAKQELQVSFLDFHKRRSAAKSIKTTRKAGGLLGGRTPTRKRFMTEQDNASRADTRVPS
jgi:hypothetical protein